MRIAIVEMLVNGEEKHFEYQNAYVKPQCYIGFDVPFEIRVEFLGKDLEVEYISHPISNVLRYWNKESKYPISNVLRYWNKESK